MSEEGMIWVQRGKEAQRVAEAAISTLVGPSAMLPGLYHLLFSHHPLFLSSSSASPLSSLPIPLRCWYSHF